MFPYVWRVNHWRKSDYSFKHGGGTSVSMISVKCLFKSWLDIYAGFRLWQNNLLWLTNVSENITFPAPTAIRIEIAFVQSAAGGCLASRNCQTKNKTRFILKEMLFWLQWKEALDWKVQEQCMIPCALRHRQIIPNSYLKAYQRKTANSLRFVALFSRHNNHA